MLLTAILAEKKGNQNERLRQTNKKDAHKHFAHGEDLTTVASQRMDSLAAKRKIQTKDDKMLTLERYFESCGRDLSRTLIVRQNDMVYTKI